MAACGSFGSDTPAPAGAGDGGAADAGLTDVATPVADAFGAPAQDLATGQQTPAAIVVDALNVYWVDEATASQHGAVMKVAKGGGDAIILAASIGGPGALAADATRLYFTANDNGPQYSSQNLFRQDKAGGAAERLLITANDAISGCSVEGGSVFWALASNGGEVGWVDTSSWTVGSIVRIAQDVGGVRAVVADGTHVYAGTTTQLLKVDRSNAAKSVFGPVTGGVKALLLDSATSTVYWADASSIMSLDTSSPAASTKTLAKDQGGPSAIAVDALNVYWSNLDDGSIRSVPKAGGAPTTIATGESEPRGIAVDDSGLYWTNHGDGRIRVVRR